MTGYTRNYDEYDTYEDILEVMWIEWNHNSESIILPAKEELQSPWYPNVIYSNIRVFTEIPDVYNNLEEQEIWIEKMGELEDLK